ncbi:DHA2 family efflux MFS transporter permease subunit [Streptomyces orinoci]|uniref:DHA2 family efflux MFS transporter permease subunit n=1 Tax=Streptomyces orinoci TaxID=67339 RepID=A0ABV3JTI8_STRON|nr:DHA2 family efflux MFS transporter permease subunit [Streptomyces orinoci]
MSAQASTAPAGRPGLDRSLTRVALILVLGAFVALLDTTVIGVAVHALGQRFGAGPADVQWATTGYLLALAAVIPATGWAAQRFGATRAWTGSLAVLLAGSVLCGLAWSLGSLVAFRVVQGLGAGGLFPLSRLIVVEVAGRERMGRMMALMAVPAVLAPVVGPVVGGVLVQELSWRWVFLLNVPVLLAAIVLTLRFIPASRGSAAERLDAAGLVAVSGGLALLLHGLSRLGGRAPASSWGLPLLAGAALLAGYGLWTARAARPGVIRLGLFRDRAFAVSCALAFLGNFALFAGAFLVPLFFQQDAAEGALGAGLVMAPQGLGMLAAVLVAGRLMDSGPPARTMVLGGLALVLAGTLPFALVQPGSGQGLLAVALFVRGIGLTFAISPTMKTLYHSLPADRMPDATTANAIGQQLGGALGTAVVAVVLQRVLDGGSAAAGFHAAFWVTVGCVGAAMVAALRLPREA